MSRDGHMASVLAAQVKLNMLHDLLSRALDEQDEALASVAVAVGLEPATDTARRAFVRTADAATAVQQALIAVNEARQAMVEYRTHF